MKDILVLAYAVSPIRGSEYSVAWNYVTQMSKYNRLTVLYGCAGEHMGDFEEMIDYIRCMTITQNVDPSIYLNLDADSIKKINAYIDDKMTATTFPEDVKKGGMREQVTSELIYYWMVNFNIPFECEKWHLNRLLTLIQVCSVKANASGKKMTPQEVLKQNNELNALRRKQLGSKG